MLQVTDTTTDGSFSNNESKSDILVPEMPPNSRVKFFVGGLPPRTEKFILKNEFVRAFNIEQPELIDQIKVMIKLGYGFISIPQEFLGVIEPFVKETKMKIDGKSIELDIALKRKDARLKIENERNRKLYVGGIPLDVNKDSLIEYFSTFGELEYVNLVMNINSNLPRGFAFIKYNDEDSASKVLKIKIHKIKNFKVIIRKSEPKQIFQDDVAMTQNEKQIKDYYELYLKNGKNVSKNGTLTNISTNMSSSENSDGKANNGFPNANYGNNYMQSQQNGMFSQSQNSSSQIYENNEECLQNYWDYCQKYPEYPMEFHEYMDYINYQNDKKGQNHKQHKMSTSLLNGSIGANAHAFDPLFSPMLDINNENEFKNCGRARNTHALSYNDQAFMSPKCYVSFKKIPASPQISSTLANRRMLSDQQKNNYFEQQQFFKSNANGHQLVQNCDSPSQNTNLVQEKNKLNEFKKIVQNQDNKIKQPNQHILQGQNPQTSKRRITDEIKNDIEKINKQISPNAETHDYEMSANNHNQESYPENHHYRVPSERYRESTSSCAYPQNQIQPGYYQNQQEQYEDQALSYQYNYHNQYANNNMTDVNNEIYYNSDQQNTYWQDGKHEDNYYQQHPNRPQYEYSDGYQPYPNVHPCYNNTNINYYPGYYENTGSTNHQNYYHGSNNNYYQNNNRSEEQHYQQSNVGYYQSIKPDQQQYPYNNNWDYKPDQQQYPQNNNQDYHMDIYNHKHDNSKQGLTGNECKIVKPTKNCDKRLLENLEKNKRKLSKELTDFIHYIDNVKVSEFVHPLSSQNINNTKQRHYQQNIGYNFPKNDGIVQGGTTKSYL